MVKTTKKTKTVTEKMISLQDLKLIKGIEEKILETIEHKYFSNFPHTNNATLTEDHVLEDIFFLNHILANPLRMGENNAIMQVVAYTGNNAIYPLVDIVSNINYKLSYLTELCSTSEYAELPDIYLNNRSPIVSKYQIYRTIDKDQYFDTKPSTIFNLSNAYVDLHIKSAVRDKKWYQPIIDSILEKLKTTDDTLLFVKERENSLIQTITLPIALIHSILNKKPTKIDVVHNTIMTSSLTRIDVQYDTILLSFIWNKPGNVKYYLYARHLQPNQVEPTLVDTDNIQDRFYSVVYSATSDNVYNQIRFLLLEKFRDSVTSFIKYNIRTTEIKQLSKDKSIVLNILKQYIDLSRKDFVYYLYNLSQPLHDAVINTINYITSYMMVDGRSPIADRILQDYYYLYISITKSYLSYIYQDQLQ